MEKKVVQLELETTGFDQVEQQTKSIKAQLKEAQAEVVALSEKFGATSAEAVKAAKKAAELKDAIGDAKDLTDSFNPDAKFNSLTRSIGGAMDGFSAFQGTLGLIGVESQDVEKMILKVQSAMAVSQGIQGILEAKDSFKQLGAVISQTAIGQKVLTAAQIVGATAMKVLNAVMKANPIFLIIGGITALIGAFKYFSSSTETAEKANEKLNVTLERQLQLFESLANESKRRNDKALQLLEAEGASEDELHIKKLDNMALEKYYRDNLINDTLYAIKEKTKLYKKALEEENWEVAKTIGDEIKASQQKYKDLVIANKNYHDDVKIENASFSQDEIDEQNRIAKEAQDKAKENADKARAKKQEALENIKKLEAEYRLNQKTEQEKEIFLVQEKYKQALADAKKYGKDNSQLLLAQKDELKDIDDKYKKLEVENVEKAEAEKKAITDKATADKIAKEDSEFLRMQELTTSQAEYEKLVLAQKYEAEVLAAKGNADLQIALKTKLDADILAIDEETARKKIALENDIKVAKIQLAGDAINVIADIATLFLGKSEADARKAFKINKAASLASAIVSTYLGANAIFASAAANPKTVLFPAQPFIAAGIAIASGFANVAKIARTKFEGGGSGGGGGGNNSAPPSGLTQPVTSSAPSFQIVGNAGANPLAGLGGAPIKAYVVSAEVTTSQQLDRNHVKNATFG
jgi:hypothetical protein